MQLTFRPIRPEEISEASYLVDAAYEPQIREIYGENSPLRKWRHYEESKIESYVEREPDGVRVGVWRDKLITFNVCRSYGYLGWFHTLAVHPTFQKRGLGQQAVADAESYLAQQGVTAVGLMTWPTAIKNLAFYQHLGYRLDGLSIYAYRHTDTPIITGRSPFYTQRYTSIPAAETGRVESAIRALCQSISLGLDYLPLISWASTKPYAETLLIWRNGSLAALAQSYFFPKMHWAEGKLLLLKPGLSPSDIRWVLEHLRIWTISHNREAFGLPVDLTTNFASAHLLPTGFRFFAESMVNLVKGDDLPPAQLHFVRFGG